MDRREFIKVGGVGVGAIALSGGVGAGALLTTACPSFDTGGLLSWTDDIVSSLKAAQPLLTSLGVPNIETLVVDALVIAKDLRDAFAAGIADNYVKLYDQLDTLFVKVANDIGIIPIALRVPIEAALALGNIALNLIANHLKKTVVSTPGATSQVRQRARQNSQIAQAVAKIEARADEKPWGKMLRK